MISRAMVDRPSTVRAGWAVSVGALLGLTWAAGLRGWMRHLAGANSDVTWVGTFLCLLLPGILTGALLGWAHGPQRDGRWRRLLLAAPTLLIIGPLCIPGALPHLLATGQGAGSIGMVGLAMVAGLALSGRGPVVVRALAGVIGFAVVPIMLSRARNPDDAWAATLFGSLFVTLALACAATMRRLRPIPGVLG